MGVSHRYRLIVIAGHAWSCVRGGGQPRASFCLFASALRDASSSNLELKLFASAVRPVDVRRPPFHRNPTREQLRRLAHHQWCSKSLRAFFEI